MKRFIVILAFALFAPAFAHGAIAFKRQVSCVPNPTFALTCTGPNLVVDAGDTIVVGIYVAIGGLQYHVPGGCGYTWQQIPPIPNTGVDLWAAVNVPTANPTCQITIDRTTAGGDTRFKWIAVTYSGVNGVAQQLRITSPSGTLCSASITISQSDNYVLGFFTVNTGPGTTTPVPGSTQRAVTSPVGVWAIDNTSPTAGTQLTVGIQPVNNVYCYGGLLELTQPGATGKTAEIKDQMQDVLLTSATNANYRLPGAVLSPTWCTWVMPTGSLSATYNLVPQSGAELNGQTANMQIPPWQMSRLCEDENAHYWASPPLRAGANVTITPSSTAITISATGVGGGGTIATGTVQLGGTSVNAGSCEPVATVAAAGVLTSDVVSWSHVAQPGGNWETYMKIAAWPTVNNVNFIACNISTGALTPSNVILNWRVAR